MTLYTLEEITEIGKHLALVREMHSLNEDSIRIRLALPGEIKLTNTSHGLSLGIIMWSDDLEDYVFAPHFRHEPEPEPDRAPPKWASTIPMPTGLNF